MAVEIKSGAGSDLLTIDPISKAIRVTSYYPNGTPHEHIPELLTVNPVTEVNNDIIASFDTEEYKYISIQLTGTWVGTVKFQGSNDNGTFEDLVVQNTGSVLAPYVTEMTANGGVKIPVLFKFLRIRVTAYTSGIVRGTAYGYAEASNTGQISTVGTVDIAPSQVIGLSAGTEYIGNVKVLPTISAPVIPLKVISAVGVNATFVQAGPTNINFILIVSTAATPRFVKFYDKASAPVVGTDIPTHTFPLAAGASPIQAPPKGFNFTTGFAFAILLGVADNSTQPFTVAGEVVMMMEYT